MNELNITKETTLYNDNKAAGWKGYGSVEHECGYHVDVGTGEHSMVEDFYCPQCKKWFEVDWNGILVS